jgi:hypothetical protein
VRDLQLFEFGKIYRHGGECRTLILALTGPPPTINRFRGAESMSFLGSFADGKSVGGLAK